MVRGLVATRRRTGGIHAKRFEADDLESYRKSLRNLRARLRGDVEQLTDEALHRNGPEGSGNLSNMPLHMADVGTENYDQEFDLELVENQQGTLDQIHEALERIEDKTFGLCLDCGGPIAKPPAASHPLHSAMHRVRQEDGGPMMGGGPRIPLSRYVLFGAIALGGAAFDLATKSYIFATVGPEGRRGSWSRTSWSCGPATTRGFVGVRAEGSALGPDLRRAVGRGGGGDLLVAVREGGGPRPAVHRRARAHHGGAAGNCYDRLRFGYVRDFVYFHVDAINFQCAIFNFADNMLVLGAVGLMLLALRPEPASEPAKEAAAAGVE